MSPATARLIRLLFVVAAALAAACGGSDGTSGNGGLSHEGAYSIVVKVVDVQGQPVGGVSVTLYGAGPYEHVERTDAEGTATLRFGFFAVEEVLIAAFLDGYYPAERRLRFSTASGSVVQQLTVIRTDEVRLALIGTTSEASADASSVVVSLDIGAFDRSGSPIETISTAAFHMPGGDCIDGAFGACVFGPSGEDIPNSWFVLSRTSPPTVMLVGSGTSLRYRVQYVLESSRGMFSSGRTTYWAVEVRLGADTVVSLSMEIRM